MRIRRRLGPSSSNPSVPPVSDPQLHQSPEEVQQTNFKLHPHGNQERKTDYLPSDHPNQQSLPRLSDQLTLIRFSGATTDHERKMKQKELSHGAAKVKGEESSSTNETRDIGSNLGSAVADTTGVELPPSTSDLQVERWVEGDKTIPLKKKIMKSKPKIKSKTTHKKFVQHNSCVEESTPCSNIAMKMNNKRGSSVIMEGSRCSRVNGRGWRCFQQTLVGYSLCEHHLGKGRFRNITPSRTIANTTVAPQQAIEPKQLSISLVQYKKDEEILSDDSHDEDDDDDDDDDDFRYDNGRVPLLVRKKRTKPGMVKARSLSSLLNETNNAAVFQGSR